MIYRLKCVMVISSSTTSIAFYPFVDFTGIVSASIEVWHKPTKIKVTSTETVVKTNSLITMDLPSLTDIDNAADDLDMLLIRVYDGTTLMWEYLVTWSDGVTDINKEQKEWTETNPNQTEWARVE